MIKKQVLVFSILFLFFSCNEKPQEKKSEKTFTELNQIKNKEKESDSLIFDYTNSDTLFIQKDSLLGTAQSIYFEENKDHKFYKEVINFDFNKLEKSTYESSVDYVILKKPNLIKQKPVLSLNKWITLKKYKGKFYLYKPCDFYIDRISFNDSTFIDWTFEGAVANKIVKQKQIDEDNYYFEVISVLEEDRKIIIHIIDNQKGIAVFEEIINKTDKSYRLMIDADKIKSVPLIVNNCKIKKQEELEFDDIDYEKLLNKN